MFFLSPPTDFFNEHLPTGLDFNSHPGQVQDAPSVHLSRLPRFVDNNFLYIVIRPSAEIG